MKKATREGMVSIATLRASRWSRNAEDGTVKNLAKMKDEDIDTSDIPELTEKFWKNAVRGNPFYRPVKRAVSLRLDADVIAWLKKDGAGYQTRANNILRERMMRGD